MAQNNIQEKICTKITGRSIRLVFEEGIWRCHSMMMDGQVEDSGVSFLNCRFTGKRCTLEGVLPPGEITVVLVQARKNK